MNIKTLNPTPWFASQALFFLFLWMLLLLGQFNNSFKPEAGEHHHNGNPLHGAHIVLIVQNGGENGEKLASGGDGGGDQRIEGENGNEHEHLANG